MFDFSSSFSLFCCRNKGRKKRGGIGTQFKVLLKEFFEAEGIRHVRFNAHLRLNLQPLDPVQLLYAYSASRCAVSAQLNYAKMIVQHIWSYLSIKDANRRQI